MAELTKVRESDCNYFPEGTVHGDEFFYTGNFNFIWDKAKNEINIKKHGIDFRTAALVFNDPFALEEEDNRNAYMEARDTQIGIPVDENDTSDTPGFEGVPKALMGEINNVLFVVFTSRLMEQEEYFRIISARAAVKKEIDAYKKHRAEIEQQ